MTKRVLFTLAFVASLAATPLAAQISDTYIIPVAGNTAGDRGTTWATEIHIFNPQQHELNISIVFIPTGGDQAIEAIVEAGPNQTLFAENLLRDLFELAGTGALSVAAFPEDNPHLPQDDILAHSFVVGSRVYNTGTSGTFGQRVPGTLIALMEDGLSAIADGVRNSDSAGFRTNVGAVNLGRFNVRMFVQVYAPDGQSVGNRIEFMLPPAGHAQDRLPVAVDHGSAEFWIDDADPAMEALVFPYMSVVDNRSGDAVYVTPALLAFPSELAPLSSSKLASAAVPARLTIESSRATRRAARHVGTFVAGTDGTFVPRDR